MKKVHRRINILNKNIKILESQEFNNYIDHLSK
jgi:hypothetical protein